MSVERLDMVNGHIPGVMASTAGCLREVRSSTEVGDSVVSPGQMILPCWNPSIGSWDLTRRRCIDRSCLASSISPQRIKARFCGDKIVEVNFHRKNVTFPKTFASVPAIVTPPNTARVSASERGMEHSEHSSEFEEPHVRPSGRFFCCYLLVSLNPARKGRTYIG